MAYGLYLELDQSEWHRGDYSSENKLTGTIYTDKNKTKAKNLSGYTVKIRMFKTRTIGDRFNKDATITSASNGTFEYAVQEGEAPIFGLYQIKAELQKTGVKESTLNYVELLILEGPTG
ncbi:upper tail fiber [Nitrososphaeria virus YSH_174770]|uniref:Upper tail fiber n=1 Tax=Nitrososphaeria virus YSH_174770 TaxID=3071322 RepID=A0A976UAL0_9CAUD|nr:upper tail fiber [Yangshan Harbor Nitrososphaeria virus]UVF62359.1 upper tail fiber [Nitrososphaeria virus YSH_174770]|tara:strand:+ start:2557 stop:2913 length:357 start_codon:yes stop_codon:yes gene_type:complete